MSWKGLSTCRECVCLSSRVSSYAVDVFDIDMVKWPPTTRQLSDSIILNNLWGYIYYSDICDYLSPLFNPVKGKTLNQGEELLSEGHRGRLQSTLLHLIMDRKFECSSLKTLGTPIENHPHTLTFRLSTIHSGTKHWHWKYMQRCEIFNNDVIPNHTWAAWQDAAEEAYQCKRQTSHSSGNESHKQQVGGQRTERLIVTDVWHFDVTYMIYFSYILDLFPVRNYWVYIQTQ